VHRLHLTKDVAAGYDLDVDITGLDGGVAESGDEVLLVGDLGLDVIGQVVSVVARPLLTTRGNGGVGSRVHHLDIVVVVGDDNGRNVEVGLAQPAVKGNLSKHAATSVLLALLNSVSVANPAGGELDRSIVVAGDGDRVNGGHASSRGEVNGTLGAVLVEELDGVGADHGGSSSSNKGSELRELHFECSWKVVNECEERFATV